jgi:hypothetical protein
VRAAGKPDFVTTATIEALSRADFEQERNADWAVFAGRLRRGEYQRALDCISVNDGSRHATQVPEWAAAFDRARGLRRRLTLVRFEKDTADFTVSSVDEDGRRYEATVTFVTDPDGAWRLGAR